MKTFTPPGYATALDAFLDVVRFTADLPEFLVLLFHVERSLAYGKPSDCTSLSQIVDGVASQKLNTWIRKGCGLSKAAVVNANRALAHPDRPLLLIRRRSSPALGNEATEYEVNWPILSRYIAERKQQPLPPLVSQQYKPLVLQQYKPLVSQQYKPLVLLRDTHNQYQRGCGRSRMSVAPGCCRPRYSFGKNWAESRRRPSGTVNGRSVLAAGTRCGVRGGPSQRLPQNQSASGS